MVETHNRPDENSARIHPNSVCWAEVHPLWRGKGLGRQNYLAALVHGKDMEEGLSSDSNISPAAHKAWKSFKTVPGLTGQIGKYPKNPDKPIPGSVHEDFSNSRHHVQIKDPSRLQHGQMFHGHLEDYNPKPEPSHPNLLAASEKIPILEKPYRSEAQRRWAHTAAGKEALGGASAVHEWDKATKGKKLPEKLEKDMTAYHGSPHQFDKFSLKNAGVNQGLSRGHGLYFSGNKQGASFYSKMGGGKGALYTAQIPDHSETMDWDKTVSAQHPNVRKALRNSPAYKSANERAKANPGKFFSGEQLNAGHLYGGLQHYHGMTDRQASQHLRSLGVKGIRYQQEPGSEVYNHVIFHPKDVKMTAKQAPDIKKSEPLEKASKNTREQRKETFGTKSAPKAGSDMQTKHMGHIGNFAKQFLGLDLKPSGGKINEATGQRREENPEIGVDKPDWRSGQLESQSNPDAAVHELAHLMLLPKGIGLVEGQKLMDKQYGDVQKKYGYMKQKQSQGEAQPMAAEQLIRRHLGLPANKNSVPVHDPEMPLRTAVDDPSAVIGTRVVQGKDKQGNPKWVDLIRQARNLTPENKQRMHEVFSGQLKFHPERGWESNTDPNAIINVRAGGNHGEALERARKRYSRVPLVTKLAASEKMVKAELTAPKAPTTRKPNKKIRQIADQYAATRGLKLNHDLPTLKVNPDKAKKIANEYEKMPHSPTNPSVHKAYNALIGETGAQFQHIKNSGLKISKNQTRSRKSLQRWIQRSFPRY
jgi:hypothetical protein